MKKWNSVRQIIPTNIPKNKMPSLITKANREAKSLGLPGACRLMKETFDELGEEKFSQLLTIGEYVQQVERDLAEAKTLNNKKILRVPGVDDEIIMDMTKRVVETSSGRKEKCGLTFERDEDGKVEVTLPLDTPAWRRGDVNSMIHSHERYSKVASRLQKKLLERGKTPNDLKSIVKL